MNILQYTNSLNTSSIRKILVAVLLWTGCPLAIFSQVVLNEICSDNGSLLIDQTGGFNDWIELYNTGTNPIDLSGYAIGDRPEIEKAWIISSVIVPAQSHLLIFASKENPPGNELHADFKIAKEGESIYLWNNNEQLIDQVETPALEEDQSFGRQTDGALVLGFFATPTPNEKNDGLFLELALPPTTQNGTRFYSAPFSLNLFCEQANCQIRYTTDGSIPNNTSLLYQEPIEVEATTTFRYATFLPNGLPSKTITKTFFIESSHTLPIVNLTMSPETLFDEETGIFLRGPNAEPDFPFYGANYWNEEVFPAYLEFFNTDQELEIEFPMGAKIHGGTVARTRAQKPIRLLAKSEFGTNKVVHSFFEEKDVDTFERLILRNASGDFNIGNMRDGLMQRHCMKQGLNIDLQGYKPMAYYVNGVYWGMINLREKVDEHYLRYNFDVDIDELDLLEQDSIVIIGDFVHFDSIEQYALTNDLSNDNNFGVIQDNFDLESMADYFITQTILNNSDWPKNNLKFWRERKEGAKWRYLLFDLDAGMGRFGWTSFNADGWATMLEKTEVRHVVLLKKFMKNESFYHYLLNRYADLLNTSFSKTTFQEEINFTADQLSEEMERHFKKWNGDYNFWQTEEVPRLLEYAAERPDSARKFLVDYHQLEGLVNLRLNTYPEGAGTIKINTVEPTQIPWEGIYFDGIPVTISVVPNPGFNFSHWGSLYAFSQNISTTSFNRNFTQDDEITAFFTNAPENYASQLFPNPASDLVTATFLLAQPEMVSGEIYDVGGRLVKLIPEKYRNGGLQEFEFSVSDLAKGIYFLKILGEEKRETLRFLVF